MLALDSISGTHDLPCMCNRYQPGERRHTRDLFRAREFRAFNDGPTIVHPKDPGIVVRMQDGEMVLDQMGWGFPVTLKGARGQPLKPRPVNNARFDKLGGFWARWARNPAQRCLIPTARFAEAVGIPGSMTTTWLSVKDQPVFAWAGLWTTSPEWGDVFTAVMTDNAPELAAIHDRSPVVLDPANWSAWLSAPIEDLKQFDRPYPAERIAVDATSDLWVAKR
jgi:putative SOS response-associated peptidase YedK